MALLIKHIQCYRWKIFCCFLSVYFAIGCFLFNIFVSNRWTWFLILSLYLPFDCGEPPSLSKLFPALQEGVSVPETKCTFGRAYIRKKAVSSYCTRLEAISFKPLPQNKPTSRKRGRKADTLFEGDILYVCNCKDICTWNCSELLFISVTVQALLTL